MKDLISEPYKLFINTIHIQAQTNERLFNVDSSNDFVNKSSTGLLISVRGVFNSCVMLVKKRVLRAINSSLF